jgi:flagellar motor switch protein FliN
MADNPEQETPPTQAGQGDEDTVQVQEAELPEAADQPVGEGGGQIDILLDTPISLLVKVGQADIPVRQLLQVTQGSVIQLDQRVGEPVEVLLRGAAFATGQLVVVGDRLGVRVGEILSSTPEEADGSEAA